MTQRASLDHYAYSGLSVSIGILAVALAGYWFSGLELAAGMVMGAICVSINDVPTPARHKLLETLAGLVLGTLVMILISWSQPHTWLLGACVLLVSFVAAMVTAYGRKAMPLSFSLFFTMVLALSTSLHGAHPALIGHFALGGSLYLIYALAVSRLLSFRTRQQALGESLQELANYLRRQGDFFDTAIPMEACYRALIGQQAVVAEKLQTARDLLFRQMRSERDGMLAATLVKSLELFEQLLSIQMDYGSLRQHHAGSDLLMFFRDLSRKASHDLEHIGDSLIRGVAADARVNYKAEMYAIEHEMGRLRPTLRPLADGPRPLAVVIGVYDKTLHCIDLIQQIRHAAHTPVAPGEAVGGVAVEHFLSRPNFSMGQLLGNLSFQSPVFRYALRVVMAMACGYWVDLVLPYTAHGYWILLTIAVIMRSSYSQTRQRQWDRISGNILGCILAAFLLWATNNPLVLMMVVFAAVGVAHAQTSRNYRYTAMAACLLALLPIHFMEPDSRFLIAERLLDTGVGALIAWCFSFILPNWESRSLPGLVDTVLKASAAYTRMTLNPAPDSLHYRLARKQLIDAIAALGTASQRMLDEPENRRHGLEPLNAFITDSYLLAAQLASVRLLLQQRGGELDLDSLAPLLAESAAEIAMILAGQSAVARTVPGPLPEPAPGSAQGLLQQRLADLRDDAREMFDLALYLIPPQEAASAHPHV